MRGIILGLMILLLGAFPALAVEPDEVLKDPVLEARARTLSTGLRCLVCQNQSIDDSEAPLARDLRILIRERLGAGDTDDEVRRYIVDRYGDFVLLKPPFSGGTLVLWLAPFAILLAGGAFLVRRSGREGAVAEGPMSDEEKRRLKTLLDQ